MSVNRNRGSSIENNTNFKYLSFPYLLFYTMKLLGTPCIVTQIPYTGISVPGRNCFVGNQSEKGVPRPSLSPPEEQHCD